MLNIFCIYTQVYIKDEPLEVKPEAVQRAHAKAATLAKFPDHSTLISSKVPSSLRLHLRLTIMAYQSLHTAALYHYGILQSNLEAAYSSYHLSIG